MRSSGLQCVFQPRGCPGSRGSAAPPTGLPEKTRGLDQGVVGRRRRPSRWETRGVRGGPTDGEKPKAALPPGQHSQGTRFARSAKPERQCRGVGRGPALSRRTRTTSRPADGNRRERGCGAHPTRRRPEHGYCGFYHSGPRTADPVVGFSLLPLALFSAAPRGRGKNSWWTRPRAGSMQRWETGRPDDGSFGRPSRSSWGRSKHWAR
jgi:hypothetical protein